MAIKKLWLDESEDECTSCDNCEAEAPEVFEVQDKMVVKPDADLQKNEKAIMAAIDSCPTNVIKVEKS